MKFPILLMALFTLALFAEVPALPPSGQSLGSTPGFGGKEDGRVWEGTYPERYKKDPKKQITGRCIIGSEEAANLEIDCPRVTFSFQNLDGKELSKVTVAHGRFAIYPPSGTAGYFKIVSDKYKITTKTGPYHLGDDVIIRLESVR